MSILKLIWSILSAIALLITNAVSPLPSDSAESQLISSKAFVLNEALVTGQGITNDGEYYYTSGSLAAVYTTFLAKFDMKSLECVDKNIFALPLEYIKMGYNHIGGISYYDGKIYASVEGDTANGYIASIMTFDAETLEFDGGYYPLPKEDYDDGVPWCAVDKTTGLLYASKWTKAEKIHVYDTANSMAKVGELKISGEEYIDRIQGGEVYGGYVYLSGDCRDGETKNVFKTDLKTGYTTLAFSRNIVGEIKDTEAEGITIKEVDSSPVFCVLDYDKAITVFLREYVIQ